MKNLAVLISSCKAYSDLWPPLFRLMEIFWPDCPYKVVVATDKGSYEDTSMSVSFIETKNRNWGGCIKETLEQMDEDYIIYLQDDYLLTERVDTERLAELHKHTIKTGSVCLRLFPCPGPDREDAFNLRWLSRDGRTREDSIGVISPGQRYRTSLQSALWDRKYFSRLIHKADDPWEFERDGERRAAKWPALFTSVSRKTLAPIPYYCTAVVKGKWEKNAVELCRKHDIEPDLSKRGINL